MKKLFFIFIFATLPFLSYGQQTNEKLICSYVFDIDSVHVKPDFAGGREEFINIFYKNLTWPCGEQGFGGTIDVRFIIDMDGSMKFIEIMDPVAPCLDNEIKRVFKLIPNWQPGSYYGTPVCVSVKIPIILKLGY